jgi:hypothetical protein
VSNEASGLLERHIEKMGIAYPIAKVKGESADRIYGVKGFPSAALVDASGRVIWSGHPSSVPRGEIEKALEGTAFLPRLEGKAYKKVDKLIVSREYGKAHAEVLKGLQKDSADETLQGAQVSIEALLEKMQGAANAAVEGQDFGVALDTYSQIEKLFKGHEAAKLAKADAKAVEKNPAAKDEIAAWKKMVKADETQFEGDFEKAGKLYAAIAKKYPETKSGERAQAFLSRHHM